MTNLADFLKCEKVRCVDSDNTDLTYGNEYTVLALRLRLTDDNGVEWNYDYDHFEPVFENQATNVLYNTPMGTRTVNEFEVGDKVYCPPNSQIIKIEELTSGTKGYFYRNNLNYFERKHCVSATPKNYEMLCKLYPHIEFEKPPKELTGSNLCRALLKKGWKYVPCYVSDSNDEDALNKKDKQIAFIEGISENYPSFFTFYNGRLYTQYAVPFDPRTGNVLTCEVLSD